MKRLVLVLLCLLNCPHVTASDKRVRQYTLKQQHVGDDQIVLRLINRATGQAVWKQRVGDLDCVGWSPDHKALALSIYMRVGHTYITGKTPFRLLVWREGKPVRLLDDSREPSGGFIDGVIDIAWSPDDRRVLFRVYQSGGKSINVGRLYCLDTKSWHLSSVPDGVRQMQWLGPNQVRFRVMKTVVQGNDCRLIEDVRPHFWNFR